MDTDPQRLDRLFHSLSDSTRRRIYETLAHRPGLTTKEVAAMVPRLTRWAVMKHLAALREAGLIQTLPEGRRRRHFRDERALDALREWLQRAR